MGMEDFSRGQQKIIKRHYANAEGIGLQRLGELITDLYLAEGKKAERLWVQVEAALAKLEIPESQKSHLLAQRDLTALANLLTTLSKKPAN